MENGKVWDIRYVDNNGGGRAFVVAATCEKAIDKLKDKVTSLNQIRNIDIIESAIVIA